MSLSEFGYQASSAAVTFEGKNVTAGRVQRCQVSLAVSVDHELVTGAGCGLEQLRCGRVDFDFLPQAVHQLF
jgi:hypothetical protein